MNPLDSFDKMVARMNTTELTNNTTRLTELPDSFEPETDRADSLARIIP